MNNSIEKSLILTNKIIKIELSHIISISLELIEA